MSTKINIQYILSQSIPLSKKSPKILMSVIRDTMLIIHVTCDIPLTGCENSPLDLNSKMNVFHNQHTQAGFRISHST